MRYLKIALVLYCLLSIGSNAFSSMDQDIYKKANLSYEKKDYKEAVYLYEELLDMNSISPEVYYNLGNSYFKLNNIGKAILNYKRALRMKPRDRDIIKNLDIARSLMQDKIEHDNNLIISIMLYPYRRLSLDELTMLASIFYFLIIMSILFYLFFIEKRKIFIYTFSTCIIFFIIVLLFLIPKIYNTTLVKKAIVTAEAIDVKSGPDFDYLLQFSLHEGSEITIKRESNNWYEIELSKDLRGWVPKDSVDII